MYFVRIGFNIYLHGYPNFWSLLLTVDSQTSQWMANQDPHTKGPGKGIIICQISGATWVFGWVF